MKNVILSARRVHTGFSSEKKHKPQSSHLSLRLLAVPMTTNIYDMIVINKWQLGVTRDKPRKILLWEPHYLYLPKVILRQQGHIAKEKLKQS